MLDYTICAGIGAPRGRHPASLVGTTVSLASNTGDGVAGSFLAVDCGRPAR